MTPHTEARNEHPATSANMSGTRAGRVREVVDVAQPAPYPP